MKVKLTIGDWSQDGHTRYEIYVYDVNKSVTEIRQAYKDSCKKTGLQFNHNENYSGLPEHSCYGTSAHICTEYESSDISENAKQILTSFGIDMFKYFDEDEYIATDKFAELILDFIKISLTDLTYAEGVFKKSELKLIEPINGWWNGELNVQFGYGLFL